MRMWWLRRLVGDGGNLLFPEWLTMYQQVIELRPDLLLEVGRGYGNSTTLLTEVANELEIPAVSVGLDGTFAWQNRTVPRLERVRPPTWFERLVVIDGLMEETDVDRWLSMSARTFLFWDAHGRELAEHMVARVLPRLPTGSRVLVHDIERGTTPRWSESRFRYGDYWSPYEEVLVLAPWAAERRLEMEDVGGSVAFTV